MSRDPERDGQHTAGYDQKNASSRTVVITGLVPAIPPRDALPLASVMPGFMPGIHVLKTRRKEDVDGRDKPGHDWKAVPRVRRMRGLRSIAAR